MEVNLLEQNLELSDEELKEKITNFKNNILNSINSASKKIESLEKEILELNNEVKKDEADENDTDQLLKLYHADKFNQGVLLCLKKILH